MEWKAAGLLFPSVATGVLRTVTGAIIERTLGTLTRSDMDAVDQQLRRALAL